MRWASASSPSGSQHGTLRRRAVAMLLTLAIEALLLLMLLRLAVFPPEHRVADMGLTVINVAPETDTDTTRTRERTRRPSGGAPRRAPTPLSPPHAEAQGPPPPLHMILLTREQYASADIAAMPSQRPERTADAGGAGTATGNAAGAAAGEAGGGPNGQQLFAADWFRKPTHQELSYYLPANAPPEGWGMIACQTVANYRVENCREIGQSPQGSGLGRAVLDASWQFRVLPPRINGRQMIGAWVRILITFSQNEVRTG